MDNLITDSYFWGERFIPKLNAVASATLSQAAAEMSDELNLYIAKYQKYYLEAMFGETIAADMPDALVAMIVDKTTKTSPIADCVYYFMMREKNTSTLPSGEKQLAIQNTIIASANAKMVKAWNDMVKASRKVHEKLYNDDSAIAPLVWQTDIADKIDFTHDIFQYINEINV